MTVKGNGLEKENFNFLHYWSSETQEISDGIWAEWQVEGRGFGFIGKIKFASLEMKFKNITFASFSWQYSTSHIKLDFLSSSHLYYPLETVSFFEMNYVTFLIIFSITKLGLTF